MRQNMTNWDKIRQFETNCTIFFLNVKTKGLFLPIMTKLGGKIGGFDHLWPTRELTYAKNSYFSPLVVVVVVHEHCPRH